MTCKRQKKVKNICFNLPKVIVCYSVVNETSISKKIDAGIWTSIIYRSFSPHNQVNDLFRIASKPFIHHYFRSPSLQLYYIQWTFILARKPTCYSFVNDLIFHKHKTFLFIYQTFQNIFLKIVFNLLMKLLFVKAYLPKNYASVFVTYILNKL